MRLSRFRVLWKSNRMRGKYDNNMCVFLIALCLCNGNVKLLKYTKTHVETRKVLWDRLSVFHTLSVE